MEPIVDSVNAPFHKFCRNAGQVKSLTNVHDFPLYIFPLQFGVSIHSNQHGRWILQGGLGGVSVSEAFEDVPIR